MVLTPDVRGEQVVQRRHRRTPVDGPGCLQPLGVLVEHRVDQVDERLVAAEEAVPTGQEVALEPALAGVLRQHLDHPAAGGEVLVEPGDLPREDLVGDGVHAVEAVGRRLVRSEDAEVVRVVADDVHEIFAQHPGRLVRRAARGAHGDGVGTEVGKPQGTLEQPPVGVGVGAHPPHPLGSEGPELGRESALVIEQLGGPVGTHPLLQLHPVAVVLAGRGQRHLMRSPGALDRDAVDHLRPGPSLGCDQQDHRPDRASRLPLLSRGPLDLADPVVRGVHRVGQLSVHPDGSSPSTVSTSCPYPRRRLSSSARGMRAGIVGSRSSSR